MSRLIALGSGLLLGAGLGIIIPECVLSTYSIIPQSERVRPRGVEAVIEANEPRTSSGHSGSFPAMTIATSLLVGFTFMLIVEQLTPGAHSHPGPHAHGSGLPSPMDSTIEFDADLEMGESENPTRPPQSPPPRSAPRTASRDGFKAGKGFTLTLGLVLHALSDGLALGSSIASDAGSRDLSLVIFAALAIHKGMEALGVCVLLRFSDRMACSTDCARADNLLTGERHEPHRLQKVPRNIQRLYTHRRSPHLSFPVVL